VLFLVPVCPKITGKWEPTSLFAVQYGNICTLFLSLVVSFPSHPILTKSPEAGSLVVGVEGHVSGA